MNEYHQIKTDTWQIMIPPDWSEQSDDNDGVLYFQSADETKGLYISVLLAMSDHKGDADGALEMVRQAEMDGFSEMEGHQWFFAHDSTTTDGAVRIAMLDAYDSARQYRIVAKIIVTLPSVVRASFHDYSCEDYNESRRFFDPIVRSLELRNGA